MSHPSVSHLRLRGEVEPQHLGAVVFDDQDQFILNIDIERLRRDAASENNQRVRLISQLSEGALKVNDAIVRQ